MIYIWVTSLSLSLMVTLSRNSSADHKDLPHELTSCLIWSLVILVTALMCWHMLNESRLTCSLELYLRCLDHTLQSPLSLQLLFILGGLSQSRHVSDDRSEQPPPEQSSQLLKPRHLHSEWEEEEHHGVLSTLTCPCPAPVSSLKSEHGGRPHFQGWSTRGRNCYCPSVNERKTHNGHRNNWNLTKVIIHTHLLKPESENQTWPLNCGFTELLTK